ncbi:hypothetical protein QR680_011730 [Steinernema hermaphroditum]|uniref:Uncharacterized protein n=1 Tax=Steinernema hermaphroditum TaxID=289476 RepID=A0AA39I266_9BILA|nr:hypothetical protein QR680_011730 [Steinernema hermaphroditum]
MPPAISIERHGHAPPGERRKEDPQYHSRRREETTAMERINTPDASKEAEEELLAFSEWESENDEQEPDGEPSGKDLTKEEQYEKLMERRRMCVLAEEMEMYEERRKRSDRWERKTGKTAAPIELPKSIQDMLAQKRKVEEDLEAARHQSDKKEEALQAPTAQRDRLRERLEKAEKEMHRLKDRLGLREEEKRNFLRQQTWLEEQLEDANRRLQNGHEQLVQILQDKNNEKENRRSTGTHEEVQEARRKLRRLEEKLTETEEARKRAIVQNIHLQKLLASRSTAPARVDRQETVRQERGKVVGGRALSSATTIGSELGVEAPLHRRLVEDLRQYEESRRLKEEAEDRDGRTRAPVQPSFSLVKAYRESTSWEKEVKKKDKELRNALKENARLRRERSKSPEVSGLFEARMGFLTTRPERCRKNLADARSDLTNLRRGQKNAKDQRIEDLEERLNEETVKRRRAVRRSEEPCRAGPSRRSTVSFDGVRVHDYNSLCKRPVRRSREPFHNALSLVAGDSLDVLNTVCLLGIDESMVNTLFHLRL